ncbi:Vacuolar protein sorting-associated protein 16 [Massospora cicadina]|nr:Vacuolar protein sorting-associated protein 16 [Massospora cicadina]
MSLLTTGLRREERYEMAWKRFSIDEMVIAVGPMGGLIAAVRDANKLAVVDRGAGTADTVTIYTSAGKKLNAIKWDTGQLVAMGWDFSDHLLLVFAEGLVRRHVIFGGRSQFSLGLAPGEAVKDARFWPEGLVVRTSGGDFFAVANVLEPRPRKLAPAAIKGGIHCWSIIPPAWHSAKTSSKGAQDLLLQRGPFHHIAVSPSGGYLAPLTQGGKLLVVSADFQQKLREHDLAEKARPSQMVWCGNDYILALYGADLIVVDPTGTRKGRRLKFMDWLRRSIFYGGGAYVATEMDGARVFTNTHCEFLQKSPIQDVFGIGSTSPAALLFNALEQFEHLSPRADELVRIIGDHLEAAVEGCVAAAGFEWVPQVQRNLLRAASFGKCFLDKYNSDRFVRQCQLLRVLNALHHYEVGIPFTLAQLDALGMDNVIGRLLEMHQHFLGLKICQYLRLPSDRVVIRASLEDEATITRVILDKVGDCNGFAYHPIAKVASESGQLQLAIQVGRRRPVLGVSADGVAGGWGALDRAIASGDTNLVYLVLLQAKQKLSLGDFFRLINPRPMAGCHLEASYDQQDKPLLKDFYYQDDRRLDLGLLAIRETYAMDPPNLKAKWEEALRHLAGLKGRATEGKLADEQVKLLNHQEHLATKAGQAAIGIPLADTVTLATKVGDHRLASKLRSEFKILVVEAEGPMWPPTTGRAWRRLNPPSIKFSALSIMVTPLSFKPVVLNSQRRHVPSLFSSAAANLGSISLRPIELSYLRLPSHAALRAIKLEIRVRWALKCRNSIPFSPGVHGDPPADFDPSLF